MLYHMGNRQAEAAIARARLALLLRASNKPSPKPPPAVEPRPFRYDCLECPHNLGEVCAVAERGCDSSLDPEDDYEVVAIGSLASVILGEILLSLGVEHDATPKPNGSDPAPSGTNPLD